MRFVAYRDRKGGYIDQVAGTVNVSSSARWRPSGTMRANGVPVESGRNGFKVGTDLSAAVLPNANAIVEDNNGYIFRDFNKEIKKTKEMHSIIKKFEITNSLIILDKNSKDKKTRSE